MNVFLTGITGFIGSRLLDKLIENNYYVYGLSRDKSKFYKYNNYNNFEFLEGDLVDINVLNKLPWGKFEIIIHMAAAGVKASSRDWMDCVNINYFGTLNILKCINKYKINPIFLYPRTFYEDNNINTLKNNPYIMSKIMTFNYLNLWSKLNEGCRFINGTIYQCYGENDNEKKGTRT